MLKLLNKNFNINISTKNGDLLASFYMASHIFLGIWLQKGAMLESLPLYYNADNDTSILRRKHCCFLIKTYS